MTPREIILANLNRTDPPRPGLDFDGGRRNDFLGAGAAPPSSYTPRRWTEGNREFYDDQWGNLWVRMVGRSAKGEICRPVLTDWRQLDDLRPPDYTDPACWQEMRRIFAQPTDRYKLAYIGGWIFDDARYLRKMEVYFQDMALYPDELACLHHVVAGVYEAKIHGAAQAGADGIAIGEDLGTQKGVLFSPAMFRHYFKPEYTRLMGIAHDYGLKVLMHSCGLNWALHVHLTALIHALEPRIDVTAEIDWREIGNPERGIPGLCVRFPLNAAGELKPVRYEIPFGSVERELFEGEEVPALRYAHVSGTAFTEEGDEPPFGFTLLQDCKYGHSMEGSDLRLRIVRSSFDPDHAPEVARSVVRYSMVFQEGEVDPATLTRLGAAWNHPLLVVPANLQKGDAPGRAGFANVLTPNVVLTSLKHAEGAEGLVLRLVELNGEAVEAVVELDPGVTAGFRSAQVTDILERPSGESAAWDGRTLRVKVPAHGFVTICLAP